MKNVMITGPTGEVGLALVNELLHEDIKVYAVVRPDSKRSDRLPSHELLSVIPCSLSELEKLSKNTLLQNADIDTIYHLGWDHSRDHYNVHAHYKNIGYTLSAVRLAKSLNIKNFVGAGSQAEYGRVEGNLSPDTPAFPDTAYGMAKLCAGQMSRLLCKQLEIRHIWPRILSVYGPGDAESTMVISTIRKLLSKEKPTLTKGGQEWDFLFSEDCAKALFLIGEKGKDGAVYCIGSGKTYPLRYYFEQIRDAIDPALPLGIGEIPYRDQQVMYLCADITSLNKDTGFEPQISFQEGIRRTVEWCRNNAA